jgi:glycosyltransferase involved in cell wall biosynthesis
VKILVLAYHYPPNSGSGTFRSLYFFNRIARSGDQVCVLSARAADFGSGTSIDEALCASIDPDIQVLRARVRRPLDWLLGLRDRFRGRPSAGQAAAVHEVHDLVSSGRKGWLQAFKDLITDALSFPDHHVGWLPDAYRCGGRQIRRTRPDCIYSSGGPWTSHLVAALLKKRYGCPVVLDFRDPWAANPDLAHRSRLFRKLSYAAEAFCIRRADHVVLNTGPLRDDFVARYPGESSSKFTTLTNGFEDRAEIPEPRRRDCFNLVHTGEIYLSRNPAQFLLAVQHLIREGTIAPNRLKVQLVGGCARSSEIDALLDSEELRNVVALVPRVPHREALEYQLSADVLLLFQMGFPLQIPRKIFEYMSMFKPVLAITERSGATASLVRDSGVGVVAQPDAVSIAGALRELYGAWTANDAPLINRHAVARYRNSQLSSELRAILHAVVNIRPLGDHASSAAPHD